MKALVCEMCGSGELLKQDGVFVCQHCGTKYSVEEAKKMMFEGTVNVQGTVKVDSSDELKNLYEIARRAKRANNSENAEKYYSMILIKDPSSWEANFYTVYYQAMQCKIAEIPTASYNIINCIPNVVTLLVQSTSNQKQQESALTEIFVKCQEISVMLYKGVWQGYEPNGHQNNPLYFRDKSKPVISIITTLAKCIEILYEKNNKFENILLETWKYEVTLRVSQLTNYIYTKEDDELIQATISKIRDKDFSYQPPQYAVKKWVTAKGLLATLSVCAIMFGIFIWFVYVYY